MNKFILILLLIIMSSILSFSIYIFKQQKSVYYIENGKLYDGFALKKDYENQIQKLRMSRRNMLDSLELNIRQFEARKMLREAEFANEFYIQKAKSFEEEEEGLLSEYNQQIWKRLNQYAVEFSKEKNIDILFGASGNGTILHANPELDLTNELIQYANKRFSGK